MVLSKLIREDTMIILFGTAAVSVFSFSYGKHSALKKRYIKYFYQKFNDDNKPVEVEPHVQATSDAVLSDLKYTEWNKSFVHLFITKKWETFYAGSTKVRQGFHIGLPEHFQCRSKDHIKEIVKIDGKPVDWSSEQGKRLLESLELGENALRFVIAKYALRCDTYESLLRSMLPTFLLMAMYTAGSYVTRKLQLMHTTVRFALAMYAGIVVLFMTIHIFMSDAIALQYDKYSEDEALKLGKSYVLGAIEYYRKMLDRNCLLRELESTGQKRYLKTGDQKVLRYDQYPMEVKLVYAKEQLQKVYEVEDAMRIPEPHEPLPIDGPDAVKSLPLGL